MVRSHFHHASKLGKTDFHTGKFSPKDNLALMIAAIVLASSSAPLDAHDAASGTIQSVGTPLVSATAHNENPVAVLDNVQLNVSAQAFNVLANDTDSDGDSLMIVEATANDGAIIFTREGLIAYAQNPGPERPDTITYVASDGRGGFAQGVVHIVAR